jgi:hypothetical protein
MATVAILVTCMLPAREMPFKKTDVYLRKAQWVGLVKGLSVSVWTEYCLRTAEF